MYYETLWEAVRTLWGQRWLRALSEAPHTAPAPNAARDVAFARVGLGRESAVPPRLSLGWASPSRRWRWAPWEWGSRCRSPWSVCCSEQNSTFMHVRSVSPAKQVPSFTVTPKSIVQKHGTVWCFACNTANIPCSLCEDIFYILNVGYI